MIEYASSEIRVHATSKNLLGQLGQSWQVLFFDESTQSESDLGYILPDGTFSPPWLKELVKDKVENCNAVTTPVCLERLTYGKYPINGLL